MGVVFCPNCYKEAYRLVDDNESVKIMQDGKCLINLNNSSSVNMSINCPGGHPVTVEIKPKEVLNGTRP